MITLQETLSLPIRECIPMSTTIKTPSSPISFSSWFRLGFSGFGKKRINEEKFEKTHG
jgi:hypothetical protein